MLKNAHDAVTIRYGVTTVQAGSATAASRSPTNVHDLAVSLNIFISTTCHFHTQNIDTQIKQDWNGSCKLI